MNLALAFAQSAQRDLAKTALFWGEAQFSYGQFLAQANSVAKRLKTEFGVQRGDRVGIWLKNCPEFVPALFGVWQAEAVVVPINNFLKPAEVQFIVDDAGIKILILDESMKPVLDALIALNPGFSGSNSAGSATVPVALAGVPPANSTTILPKTNSATADTTRVFGETPKTAVETTALPKANESFHVRSLFVESIGIGDDAGGEESSTDADDLAVILYTSGTTGHPKGAMLSHANLLANVESCRHELLAVGEDRFVVLLPMFHSFMLTVGILLPMLIGGSIVLIKTLHPPKNVVMEILQHRATLLPAVPQFFRAFTHCPLPADMPLRLCISGGAPLPAETLKDFKARFPIPLLEGYGLSEASPVVSFTPMRGPWKAGSIGVPIRGVTVTIQNDESVILPTGQIGELCVQGENVMRGYWNLPNETAAALRGEWLLTGDIGYVDGDGYIYITDRKKDMLLVNGINVYPREVEEVLYQFPGIKEAAVIGTPDPRRGEQPLAFVVANDGIQLDEKALHGFVRERLADYKVPRKIIFMPALPRNATGKVLKTELRKMV